MPNNERLAVLQQICTESVFTRRTFGRNYGCQQQALEEATSEESCRPCLACSSLLGCFQTWASTNRQLIAARLEPLNAVNISPQHASHLAPARVGDSARKAGQTFVLATCAFSDG